MTHFIAFKTLLISILLVVFIKPTFAQVSDKQIRNIVLKNSNIDSLIVFGKWNEKGDTETQLKYLGNIKTKDGKIYKIVNSVFIWGLSHRASSRILIYNYKNQYVGNYKLNTVNELPQKLKEGKLIFKNQDCDSNNETIIDFTSGLIKRFFIKCSNEGGNVYEFSND